MLNSKSIIFSVFVLLMSINTYPQTKADWNLLIGSAYTENQSYNVLRRFCDEAGGRMMGSAENEKAVSILKEELAKIGLTGRSEKFTVPGWIRGNDEVKMLLPVERKIKAAALGFVNKTPAFTADVIFTGYGFAEAYADGKGAGKIVLVTQESPAGREALLRYEAIDTAAKYGARAILFINNKPGSILMDGTSNFEGKPSKIPAFTISFEEGEWMRRLIENNRKVEMEIVTNSYCKELETENVVVTLPGKVKDKIVIGAHFDSWDLGQGGVDNGIGSAVLFDVARILKKYSAENYYTIDFVWFNGEELGLWGSSKYAEMHKNEPIYAMLNMDMIGSPTGFNVMGFEELRPLFEKIIKGLDGFDLNKGIVNYPYTNSDHIPFMFKGIPVFSLQAHLDEDMVKYYHDAGDTFDKVSKKYLSDAAAVVSVTINELANNSLYKLKNKTERETISILKKHGLDKRLKRQHEWIFNEE